LMCPTCRDCKCLSCNILQNCVSHTAVLFIMPSIVFLGTSSATPTKARNVSSYALRLDDGRIILIDCGEGTQHQFVKCADLRAGKIDAIMITHLHGDHSFGLPGLLASMSMNGRDQPVKIYGPEGLKNYLESCLKYSVTFLTYPIEIVEIPTDKVTPLGLINQLTVTAYPLKHKVTCFGFLFEEPEKKGKLNAKLAKELGAENKDLGILTSGKDVTLPNGNIIKSVDVMGETRKGRKFLLLGDTCDSESVVEAAQNCLVVVHEVTYDSSCVEKAKEGGHSTSTMAGQFAKKIKASRIFITHFSSRYHGLHDTEPLTVKDLVSETQKECPDTKVEAAEDFARFEL